MKYFSRRCWGQICMKVNHAVVFMDRVFAECLHWNGGVMELINHGAENVKEFSSFEVSCYFSVVFFCWGCVKIFSKVITIWLQIA